MRMEESAAGRPMGLASASVDEAGAYSRPCTEPNRATEYKTTRRAERAKSVLALEKGSDLVV